jgi:hypothetical protein
MIGFACTGLLCSQVLLMPQAMVQERLVAHTAGPASGDTPLPHSFLHIHLLCKAKVAVPVYEMPTTDTSRSSMLNICPCWHSTAAIIAACRFTSRALCRHPHDALCSSSRTGLCSLPARYRCSHVCKSLTASATLMMPYFSFCKRNMRVVPMHRLLRNIVAFEHATAHHLAPIYEWIEVEASSHVRSNVLHSFGTKTRHGAIVTSII